MELAGRQYARLVVQPIWMAAHGLSGDFDLVAVVTGLHPCAFCTVVATADVA